MISINWIKSCAGKRFDCSKNADPEARPRWKSKQRSNNHAWEFRILTRASASRFSVRVVRLVSPRFSSFIICSTADFL